MIQSRSFAKTDTFLIGYSGNDLISAKSLFAARCRSESECSRSGSGLRTATWQYYPSQNLAIYWVSLQEETVVSSWTSPGRTHLETILQVSRGKRAWLRQPAVTVRSR